MLFATRGCADIKEGIIVPKFESVDNFLNIVRQKSEWITRFPTAGTPEPLLADRKIFYRYVILNRNIKMVYYVEEEVIHIATLKE